MAEATATRSVSATLLLLFAFGPLGSLLAMPVFVFVGALVDAEGLTGLAKVFLVITIASGAVAVAGPVAGLWIGRTSGNIFWLWLVALLAATPGLVAGLLLVLMMLR
jgi:hypothetical protein